MNIKILFLVIIGLFSFTLNAQQSINERDLDFQTFLISFLDKRSEIAAKTGNSVIKENGKASSAFYSSQIYFDRGSSTRKSYLILDDKCLSQDCVLEVQNLDVAQSEIENYGITQRLDVFVKVKAKEIYSVETNLISSNNEVYIIKYRLTYENGNYRIEYDGYIPGFQYIFEKDKFLLESRLFSDSLQSPNSRTP